MAAPVHPGRGLAVCLASGVSEMVGSRPRAEPATWESHGRFNLDTLGGQGELLLRGHAPWDHLGHLPYFMHRAISIH